METSPRQKFFTISGKEVNKELTHPQDKSDHPFPPLREVEGIWNIVSFTVETEKVSCYLLDLATAWESRLSAHDPLV